MPLLFNETLSRPVEKKSPIFCLLLPDSAVVNVADDSQISRTCALIVSWINCQRPLLCSLGGMGLSLNHFPLAKRKKSSPGFTVGSMCVTSGSGASALSLD